MSEKKSTKSEPRKTKKAEVLAMLSRKDGATIDDIMSRMTVTAKRARGFIDALRAGGHKIQLVGRCKFKL